MPGHDDAVASPFCSLIGPRLHPEAAVDEQHVARDERGRVGAEEPYRAGDVVRVAEPAERGGLRASPSVASSRQHLGQPCLHVAGGDDVRPHVAAAELPRERLREADDPRLRGRVVRLAPVARARRRSSETLTIEPPRRFIIGRATARQV